MSTRLEKLTALKAKVDEARTAKEQASGALSQIMLQLKREFNCTTLKDAKKKLTEMEGSVDGMTGKLDKLLKDFEAKHGALL